MAYFGIRETLLPALGGGKTDCRAACPREIADRIAVLASDRSGYTTGTIITIDGGGSSRRSVL